MNADDPHAPVALEQNGSAIRLVGDHEHSVAPLGEEVSQIVDGAFHSSQPGQVRIRYQDDSHVPMLSLHSSPAEEGAGCPRLLKAAAPAVWIIGLLDDPVSRPISSLAAHARGLPSRCASSSGRAIPRRSASAWEWSAESSRRVEYLRRRWGLWRPRPCGECRRRAPGGVVWRDC